MITGGINFFIKLNALFFCAIIFPLLVTAQLNNNGANIVITSGTVLVVHNLSFQNNGAFNQSAGTVLFTGATPDIISGTINPAFYKMGINKPVSRIQLQTGISINDQLQFTDGLIDLNNNNILLGSAALLTGESETSRITGPTGGYVQITKTLNAPIADDPGNLGAIISSTENLGPVIIRRGHQSQVNASNGGSSLLRYYDITPANNISLNATLRFTYKDAELNGLDENNLSAWKRSISGAWNNLSKSASNTTTNYVERTGIPDFTRFTLSTFSNALPLKWGSFNTHCQDNAVRISWKTEQEQNTSKFIIRKSADARTWITIGTMLAAGNSSLPLSYSYNDMQSMTGTNYYQIQEQDFDGKLTFSPVLMNNCGAPDELKVYPNPVQSDCWLNIQLTRGGNLLMQLYDSKGSLVQSRKESVQNGNSELQLHMRNLAKGIYMLIVTQPDGLKKVVKIEKY